jgi:hypothetical protein
MKVPLVVLTGFLGAGKTTLVNRVIAARARAGDAVGKLAIVVNELGAIGIDADLLPRGAARQVELPGGCVCCVLADELDRTIVDILDANPEVDTILLETTGVAEPVPIVWTLERPPLDARVRVAAIVTVVDPLSGRRPGHPTAAQIGRERRRRAGDQARRRDAGPARRDHGGGGGAGTPRAGDRPVHRRRRGVAPGDAARSARARRRPRSRRPRRPRSRPRPWRGQRRAGDRRAARPRGVRGRHRRLPPSYFRVKAIVHGVDPGPAPGLRWAAVHRVGGRCRASRSRRRAVAPGSSGSSGVTDAPLAACVAAAVLPSDPGPR